MSAPRAKPRPLRLGALPTLFAVLALGWLVALFVGASRSASSRAPSEPVSCTSEQGSQGSWLATVAAQPRELPERAAEPPKHSGAVLHESQAAPHAAAAPDDAHPHPLTPARQAIQRELQLIAALNDALDLRDAAGMRRVLADYRALGTRDDEALQLGYARLADCLGASGPATREAAQAYYDTQRASTLRRFIRRVCLE